MLTVTDREEATADPVNHHRGGFHVNRSREHEARPRPRATRL